MGAIRLELLSPIALPARKPILQMERVPLPVGGTISIPKNYIGLGMSQRVKLGNF
jgi:hypothetical protein